MTVLIGHSFGARILHTATCQVLIDKVQEQHPGEQDPSYGVIKGPANLLVLLNPALEASTFTVIHTVERPEKPWERIHKDQRPLLLAISSECDVATRIFFPLGQALASTFRARQVRTLGNYPPYVTHVLQKAASSQTRTTPETPDKPRFWYDQFEGSSLTLLRQPPSDMY